MLVLGSCSDTGSSTPFSPDALLVLFFFPERELGTLIDQQEGSGRKSEE